jgi:hypothetical protein
VLVFAANAVVPISNELMVTTGSKHALSSGNMTLGWREWKCHPAIEHTWVNCKMHWMAAFAKMRDISRMTTGKTTFGANQAGEIEQAQQMATSLDNLADTLEPPPISQQSTRRLLLFRRYPNGSPRHRSPRSHETQLTQQMGTPRIESLVSFPFNKPLPLHPNFNGQHRWLTHHRHIPILPPCHPSPHHHGHR